MYQNAGIRLTSGRSETDSYWGGIQLRLLAPRRNDSGEYRDRWQHVVGKRQAKRSAAPGRASSSPASRSGATAGQDRVRVRDKVRADGAARPRLPFLSFRRWFCLLIPTATALPVPLSRRPRTDNLRHRPGTRCRLLILPRNLTVSTKLSSITQNWT